jgi:GNAT superfamily N-acetyltransferase
MIIYKKVSESEIENLEKLNPIGLKSWYTEFFHSFQQPSYLIGAIDKVTFIGSEGYIGYHLIFDGKLILTHRSERTVVNPDYRGQGIFERLILKCDEYALNDNSHFSWGATAAIKPFMRAGFNSFTGFRNYSFYPIKAQLWAKIFNLKNLKYLNLYRTYQLYKSKNLRELRKLLSTYCLIKPIKIKPNNKLTLEHFEYEKVKDLLFETNQQYYKINPTLDFFNWLEEKEKKYEKRCIVLDGITIGYIIIEIIKKSNYCTIRDVYFHSESVSLDQILNTASKEKEFIVFDAFFLALNNSNTLHEVWIKDLDTVNILNIKKAGSFVIKPLIKQVKIDQLLLTDLWLEL